MTKQEKIEAKQVSQAKGLAKFLEVDFEVKIFGYTILKYHFPPQTQTDC